MNIILGLIIIICEIWIGLAIIDNIKDCKVWIVISSALTFMLILLTTLIAVLLEVIFI